MSDGQLQDAAKARRDEEARAAYLANQQAVATTPVDTRSSTTWRVLWIVAAVIFLGTFVGTVTYYYSRPDDKPASILLPTLDMITGLLTVWMILLPWLLETRSVGARVRNLVIAVVVTAILVPVGIPLFVDLGSTVANLISGLSR